MWVARQEFPQLKGVVALFSRSLCCCLKSDHLSSYLFHIHPFIFCLGVLKVQYVTSSHAYFSFIIDKYWRLNFLLLCVHIDMWEVRGILLWNLFS